MAKYLLGEQKKMHIAVKKLAHDDTKARQMNLCEVYFLSQCKHDNIAQFIAAYLGMLSSYCCRYFDLVSRID